MAKKHIKKTRTNVMRYRYVGLIFIALIAVFLYLKMIYFPGRANINEIALPYVVSEGDIANARMLDIDALRSFTGDYIVSTNTINSFKRFYDKTNDQKVALALVQMYVSHNQFDEAFALIKDIYKTDEDFSLVPVHTFLYVLFNSSELSPTNYDLIKNILEEYKSKVRIDDETYNFYSALLAVYKDDTASFYNSIDQLSGSKQFEDVVVGVKNAKKAAEGVGSSIPYYIDGLSALTLLHEGYFRVAQKRAVSIRQKDQKYILPYQILAQAALLQSHWQEAGQYFDSLLKLDASHSDQYQFGLCTSNFRQGAYQKALLHCQQVKDKSLSSDAIRYVLLSHYQVKNRDGMMNTFQLMLGKQKPSENDYYTFFDIVFYQPFVTDKDFSHVQKYYVSVILPYLDRCVSLFGASQTVCRYGQTGFYLYKNQLAKAYKDLLFLASRHPSNYVFRALGEYYEQAGEEDKAKAYYMKAMTTATDAVVDISGIESGAGNNSMNK